MPGMDGYELAKLLITILKISHITLSKSMTIARAKSKCECPVVAVTAFNSQDVVDRALAAGMKQVLFKPVDIHALQAVLTKFYKWDEFAIFTNLFLD